MKQVILISALFFSFLMFAQKAQRVAYIDMNYILENIPEYVDAQTKLDGKIRKWQLKLDDLSGEIEKLKTNLSNEKPLLTKELITEREEDIAIKQDELKRLQMAYFGPTGDLFQLRRQLAKPVQDHVYNAVQEIAKRKRYDFVLDKSSDLIILYSNSKYDISEQVLNSIVKGRKRQELDDKKRKRMKKAGVAVPVSTVADDTDDFEEEDVLTDSLDDPAEAEKTVEQIRLEEKIAKREALKARIKVQQEARIRKRDSLKKVADEKRAAKLKEIEDRKNLK
ncbi:MAG: OmpH family outer membrane protein [Flavobacteriaceae bacterium]|nr:OmpH family outer membrane protein [Flavobacteriaceae bacterium]